MMDTKKKDTLKQSKRVYGRPLAPWRAASGATLLALAGGLLAVPGRVSAAPAATASSYASAPVLDAREAFRKKDLNRLATLRASTAAENPPLAPWVDYWELNARLNTARTPEIEAFYQRWPGTYVEDRLRNDWLLELGRRRDWQALAADYPRFRMNDDREVTCYALLADHLAGKDVRVAARAAWFAQKEADDGCALMATTLYEAKLFTLPEAWRRARVAIEANRPRAARQAALLVSPQAANEVDDLSENPARYLLRKKGSADRQTQELVTLTLMRLAATDPDAVAAQLGAHWEGSLRPELAAWVWAAVGKQAALRLQTTAPTHFQQAAMLAGKAAVDIDWADDTLAWKARAALRANNGSPRWQQVVQAINAMNPNEQKDPTWVYWKARALQALARDSADPAGLVAQSQEMLNGIAGQYSFYGSLASEELGRPIAMPETPAPLTAAERGAAQQHPGLARAMQLIAIGLRNEGNREWNFSLRGMDDRSLLAAAQLACDRELWDRCINTSDRTKVEVDMAQRYPLPFRREVTARSREIGLDTAYVYGLIRQESRFIMDARSGVGASGLMQLMPATARWTAKKIGLHFVPSMITDRDTNLKLGTSYLKLLIDDLDGSQAMAAAAYNAGPNRPRRWREGPPVEPAAWAENIPFSETRDYVKKVLSNATFYAARLNNTPPLAQAPSLKARLGSKPIGPRENNLPPPDTELP
jgi:soluble lytic murein transglycosylase